MSEMTRYLTLAQSSTAEFKDKGSRFMAFAYPLASVAEAKTHVDVLREVHHKARHCCYAYRLGTTGTQFRANDDGEPAGSAGRPILGQIDSAGLTDVLVVVVRYFGGTLLGVPGLIHAYKSAAAAALAAAETLEKDVCRTVWLRCDYANLNTALRIAKMYQATVLLQDLQLDCCLQLRLSLKRYAACITAWQQTRVIEIREDI